MRTVFAGPAQVLVAYCATRGVALSPVLTRARSEAATLRLPEHHLTYGASDALWRAASKGTRDDALGLHVAEAVPVGTYRVLHFLCAHAATLGEAFRSVVRFARWADDASCLDIVRDGTRMGVTLGTGGDLGCAARQYTEYSLATCFLGVKRATQVDFWPSDVELTHPPGGDDTPTRVFGCAVRHSRPRDGLWFDQATWHTPVPRASAGLHEILEAHATQLVGNLPVAPPLLHAVCELLRQRMKDQIPQIAQIARGLGFSVRGLQRALSEAGTSYSQLIDRTRMHLAEDLLCAPRLSLTEIAFRLGYSEQSAFTRAYKRWHGRPPKSARAPSAERLVGGAAKGPIALLGTP